MFFENYISFLEHLFFPPYFKFVSKFKQYATLHSTDESYPVYIFLTKVQNLVFQIT